MKGGRLDYSYSNPHITVIANSTGSGKTVCALVTAYLQVKRNEKMTFILVPHNLLNQYEKELKKLVEIFPNFGDVFHHIKTIKDVPQNIDQDVKKVFVMSVNHHKTHGLYASKESTDDPIEADYLIFDEVNSFENNYIKKRFFKLLPQVLSSNDMSRVKPNIYYPIKTDTQVLVLDTTYQELKHLSEFTRKNMIVKCSDAFIAEGFQKCKVVQHKHKCKGITDEILLDYLDKETIQLLKEGDMMNALKSIGSVKETATFEKSIEKKFEKSLEKYNKSLEEEKVLLDNRKKRYQKIYVDKGLPDNDDVVAADNGDDEDAADLSPKQKLERLIKRTETKVLKLENFIKNETNTRDTVMNRIKEMDCGICLTSESDTSVITKCCSQTYCLDCYLSWFATHKKCPMCSKKFKDDETSFTVLTKDIVSALPKKIDEFINICKKDSDKTFVVFSNNDASFDTSKLKEAGIKSRLFQGTSATLNKILRDLENKQFQVLCINSNTAASGINLPFVDSIIYFHPPKDIFTEIQTIGRLNRMGRKKEINAHYLMWSSEKLMNE